MSGRERGNSLVEFGVAMVVIFPLLAGTFHFGYSYFAYDNLETSVRAAARYASSRTYDSADEKPSKEFASAVRNMAVYGNPAGGTRPVVPNLTTENVVVRVSFARGVPSEVSVQLSGYRIAGLFGSVPLSGKPRVAFPYIGRWAPI